MSSSASASKQTRGRATSTQLPRTRSQSRTVDIQQIDQSAKTANDQSSKTDQSSKNSEDQLLQLDQRVQELERHLNERIDNLQSDITQAVVETVREVLNNKAKPQ